VFRESKTDAALSLAPETAFVRNCVSYNADVAAAILQAVSNSQCNIFLTLCQQAFTLHFSFGGRGES